MRDAANPIGEILAGSWRAQPEPLALAADRLDALGPTLTGSGAGGLAWRRVARSPALRDTPAAAGLKASAQMQALDAARDDEALLSLARLCRQGGVDPLLFKGWAAAQHYAERHLRPIGDVDLCAPPGRFDALCDLLRDNGFTSYSMASDPDRGREFCFVSAGEFSVTDLLVDVHDRLDRFYLPGLEDVFARAVRLPLGGESMLVPAAEDHLRLVAIHFLLHGGWRALSLCDVAAMAETLPEGFDWDLCLGEVPRRRRWIAGTVELARSLLGARLDAHPAPPGAAPMPAWFAETVLGAWHRPVAEHNPRARLGHAWRRGPHRFVGEILARWPNGIRATVELDADIARLSPWPHQFAHFARSAARGLARGISGPFPAR